MSVPLPSPRLWRLENSPAIGFGFPTSPLLAKFDELLASSLVVRGDSNDQGEKEGILCEASNLSDDAFFYQYAQKYTTEKANKNEPFPLKLYRIVFEAKKNGQEDIISFSPSGRSFMIHNIDAFVENIMPKYFTSNRMASFQRQLNLYGFRRRLRGDDKGGFWHEFFVRGQRNLCLAIKRKVQTFKVPPHFLAEQPIPSPAILTPTSPSPSEAQVFHPMQTKSPAWSEQEKLSPSRESSSLDGSPSLRGCVMRSNGVLPCVPRLGLGGRSNDIPFFSDNLTRQTPSQNTIELFRLNKQIKRAKLMSALKEQAVLAAFHRLSNCGKL